jgi:methyl-accepting chemotaxis protein
MEKFAAKLRIGEKIGLGFGLVGLLFLGVIWQYHNTMQHSLSEHHHLTDVFGAKKNHALNIASGMELARRSEKDFLIQRDEKFVEEVSRHIEKVLTNTAQLSTIDMESATTSARIGELARNYQQRFEAIVEAWRIKGLDHNSGLQGAFRDAVHELETLAGQLKTGTLYLQLLQIRRGEKDLGLRREDQYRSRVFGLIEEFEKTVTASELEEEVKQRLLQEITTYRETFEEYANIVLANKDIRGGKGPFRQAAHRIEAILVEHYVPDLESNILQLRRREKDYLLRGDQKYVEMALNELERMHVHVNKSSISAEDKAQFLILMNNYQRDFMALVEQNERIDRLTEEMHKITPQIVLLVEENVEKANLAMDEMEAAIDASSSSSEAFMIWIVSVATLLGIVFAISITSSISRPLRKMSILLNRLAYEEPAERMPHVSGARDEVNLMAESVNTIADHKARFITWWQTTMQQSDACEKLEAALTTASEKDASASDTIRAAEEELSSVIATKCELLSEQCDEISRLTGKIVENTDHLIGERPSSKSQDAIKGIRHSANLIQDILEMVTFRAASKKSAS